MNHWDCPHCPKRIEGLDAERIKTDARRHMKQKHPEEALHPLLLGPSLQFRGDSGHDGGKNFHVIELVRDL